MKVNFLYVVACLAVLLCSSASAQTATSLRLNELEYFEMRGLNVMVFQDIYPEGHQGGISIIQNGVRVASNGDVRLEPTPGQWQPIPKQGKRVADREANRVSVELSYPDPEKHLKGFNPIVYPDLSFSYQVQVEGHGPSFRVVVNLSAPLPAEWAGKVRFNLELFPTILFGKTWYLGDRSGIFPPQSNGPIAKESGGEYQARPLAVGKRLSVAPEVDAQRMMIESKTSDLELYDGRNLHNNGWFVVSSPIPAGVTTRAIEWIVTPHAIPGWLYSPVVHVSQVGYHPSQKKVAVVELDSADNQAQSVALKRIGPDGKLTDVRSGHPQAWGKFLRFNYARFDFTEVKEEGMYLVEYGQTRTNPFRISKDVFKQDVWQPTLDYFLPVQMCHMRVNEQYRVWHGLCHMDDARMAPTDHNHFDGYIQGPSTLTKYEPGQAVPGLNVGGWHDAGDWDIRVESQADEIVILAQVFENFGITHDQTTIDQSQRLVEIRQPDGKPDLLQQIEHGVLTILNGYKSLGRLYRGIICPTLRQYVLLGDGVNMTDGLIYDPVLKGNRRTATHSGQPDDRWVFTQRNSSHEFKAIAALAIAGRVLKGYNDSLAAECLAAAEALWVEDRELRRGVRDKVAAAVELLLSTRKPVYREALLANRKEIVDGIGGVGWTVGRVLHLLDTPDFVTEIRNAVEKQFGQMVRQQEETPFGVPYRPHIWGAGWNIQRFGVEQYYLHKAFPEIVSYDYMLNALNFILGCHPGENTASFASGVGAHSLTVAYGLNRADYSYIPGGVGSGTALVRPDFPELKDFPYLWQQTEYVVGGGASNFMFLVIAADQLLSASAK
jgi:endoglucanase